jgi:hypothetical protein
MADTTTIFIGAGDCTANRRALDVHRADILRGVLGGLFKGR